ncbi:MAG: TonB-dependent receptor domain-containing protein, partial [Pyrinomonadaceae bacterium]
MNRYVTRLTSSVPFSLFFAFLILITIANVYPQDFRATITGQVTDQNGAMVAGASIKATRVGANVPVETRSNDEGFYTIPYLNPGTYIIEVSASGFSTVKREGIVLQTADKLNLPVALSIGQLGQEEVTVTGQELIQSGTANRGLVFDPVKVQEYPLNGRQSYMLMALTPGVIFTQEQFGSEGFSGTRGWDVTGNYKINGGKVGTNQFLLNGAPISTTGGWQVAPNIDAIQEFKVMTNTYDAQFGRTGGGTVNTTLKSGGNEYHGTLFEYMRNSVLDANTTQNNQAGAPRGKHITNQFGGTFGGPIRKDKDFVFFSLEIFREIVPFPRVSDSPPLDLRDGQHFTKYGIKIFDPLTTHVCGTKPTDPTDCIDTFVRDPFPGNVIPADRISPIGKAILDLYPAPNGEGLRQNFFATANTGRYRYHQPIVRVDHVFDDRNRIYGVYTYQNGFEDRNQNGFPPPAEVGNIISNRQDRNFLLDYTRVMSPTRVLDVRLSVGRFDERFPDGERDLDFTADQLGINIPHPPTVDRNTAPRINLGDYNSIIGNTFSFSADNQINFAPSMTQTIGRHTLHYGLEFSRIARANSGPGRANGELTFFRNVTQQFRGRSQSGLDGYSVASLLLGIPNGSPPNTPEGGFIDFNDSFYRINQYYAGFIQDDWKITPTLTLNLGLRYDVQLPFIERYNRVNEEFDFTIKNPLSDQIIANWKALKVQYDATNPQFPYPDPPAAIMGGRRFPDDENRRTYDTDYTNIQPRIGVAWSFTPKTVLRAGFGIYYRFNTQGNLSDGFSQRTPYTASLDGGITPSAGLTGPFSLQNPFPNGFISPTGSTLGPLTSIGRGIGY